MSKPEIIKIDDVAYVRQDVVQSPTTSDVRIVILQRGWVMVGYYSQESEKCLLERASVIRSWGTTKGLGEIASGGPTSSTKLDPCPPVRFHELTVIATLDCRRDKWEKHLS